MSETRIFKSLVVTNWLLQLLLYVLPFASWYSSSIADKLLALDGYNAVIQFDNPILYQAPLWGFLIASVGMLFYLNWARYLYLLLWIYGWVGALLFGFRVAMPAQGFVGMAIGTLDGAILYLAFLSVASRNFQNKTIARST